MDEDLKKRLSALLRKASAYGGSEAEAMAAAAMAARLMADAGVSQTDIEFDEAQAVLRTRRPTTRDMLWGVVAVCTNCAAVTNREWDPVVIYIGREPGPEIAVYLTDVLNRAVDREINAFKVSVEYKRRRTITTRRIAVQDFTAGLVARLRNRLLQLFDDTLCHEDREAAASVRDQRFPHTSSVNLRARSVRFRSAAASGYHAGARVQIARGVKSAQPQRMIERG